MRTIKFRAWDKNLDSWHYFSVGEQWADNGSPIYQFTGLLDKNGKEIWEGDLVEYGKTVSDVFFDKYMWNVRDFYDTSFDCPGDAFSEGIFKVIGNVWENPELLNK